MNFRQIDSAVANRQTLKTRRFVVTDSCDMKSGDSCHATMGTLTLGMKLNLTDTKKSFFWQTIAYFQVMFRKFEVLIIEEYYTFFTYLLH